MKSNKHGISAAGKSAAKQVMSPPPGRNSSPNVPKPTAGSHKPSANHKSIKGR